MKEEEGRKYYSPKEVQFRWYPCWSTKKIRRVFGNRKRHDDVGHSKNHDDRLFIGGKRAIQQDRLDIPYSAVAREISLRTGNVVIPEYLAPLPEPRPAPRKRKSKLKTLVKRKPVVVERYGSGMGTIGRSRPVSASTAA